MFDGAPQSASAGTSFTGFPKNDRSGKEPPWDAAEGKPLDAPSKHNKNVAAFRSANQTAGFWKMVMVQSSPAYPASQGCGFSPRRLIRLREVLHRTGLSRSTVYRRIELGQFPKPYPLGGRIVAWAESEVDRWIAEKVGE